MFDEICDIGLCSLITTYTFLGLIVLEEIDLLSLYHFCKTEWHKKFQYAILTRQARTSAFLIIPLNTATSESRLDIISIRSCLDETNVLI